MKRSGSLPSRLLLGAVCGLASFLIDFVAIPTLCAGWPDPAWMALMVVLPALAAWLLLAVVDRCHPAVVFAGLPVQYLLLVLLAQPLAALLGLKLDGLGELAYLGQTAAWPLVVTLVQFGLLQCLRLGRGKK